MSELLLGFSKIITYHFVERHEKFSWDNVATVEVYLNDTLQPNTRCAKKFSFKHKKSVLKFLIAQLKFHILQFSEKQCKTA